MDDVEVRLSEVVIKVSDLRDEARALIAKTNEVYEEVIEIAMLVRYEPIELQVPPVSADKEEET